MPAAYKEAGTWQPAGSDVPPAGKWWEAFGDPQLSALEARVESGSYTLAAAAARYRQSLGLLRQARGDLLPQVGVGASAEREQLSGGRPFASGSPTRSNDFTAGASLSYEIDLFGRVASAVSAAKAGSEASNADRAAVRLGLQAQLAAAYFDLRGLDARIALLQQTVEAYGRAYDLTDTRHSGGIASGLDVNRAQAQLSSARAELSAVAIARAADEHAIAVLVGEVPAGFSIPVAPARIAPPGIPVGVPSTLLERRPDIAAAERRVAAANAEIGVARAALYPRLTLGGQGGFEAAGAPLLSASNAFWALGPLQAALSIFDGGKRRAGVSIARAQVDEAAADYRQTVLTAFREVEDDLAAGHLLIAQEHDQAEAAAAAERTRDLALTRYRDGASDYLEVVTAQTAALDAERALLDIRTRQLSVATDTARAVGGAF